MFSHSHSFYLTLAITFLLFHFVAAQNFTIPPLNVSDIMGLTPKCSEQLGTLIASNGPGVLARMKLSSGGSLGDTGHYWECNQIHGAQYCLATLSLDTNANFTCNTQLAECNIGICSPSHCNEEDIGILIKHFVPGLNYSLSDNFRGFNTHCQVDTSIAENPLAALGFSFLICLVIFVLFCTIIERIGSGKFDSLYKRVQVESLQKSVSRKNLLQGSDPQLVVPKEVQYLHSENQSDKQNFELSEFAEEPDPNDDTEIEFDFDKKPQDGAFSINFNDDDNDPDVKESVSLLDDKDKQTSDDPVLVSEEYSEQFDEDEDDQGYCSHFIDYIPAPLFTLATCFSIPLNWGKLFNQIPGEFGSLNALRFFSILWVMLGHTLFFWSPIGAANLPYVYNHSLKQWYAQLIMSGIFAVDSFFFLSGFLCSYFLYERLLQGKRMEWFLIYFHRIWRILPVYSFVIIIYATITPVLGDGPFWFKLVDIISNTSKYCWTNVLFINNFYPSATDQCVGWGWFLAVDFQFFVVSPVLIFIHYKKPAIGWILLTLWLLLDLTTATTLSAVRGYSPSLIRQQPGFFQNFYQRPYNRASPYIIGLSCGYLYSYIQRHKPNFKINGVLLNIGYGLALSAMITIVFSIYWDDNWSQFENSLYLGFSRFFWGLSIAYLMMTMFLGYGGILRSFFFARAWEPFAKLTYGTYLSHPIFMMLFYFNQWGYIYYQTRNVWYYYIAHSVCALVFAVIAYLLVEKPFMNLEPILIKGTIKLIFRLRRKELPKSLQED